VGIEDWALSPIPNPQSPIPNPQSPIPKKFFNLKIINIINKLYNIIFNLFFLHNLKIKYKLKIKK